MKIRVRLYKRSSGTTESLPLEPPVRVTGGGRSSLGGNRKKCLRLYIFKARDLGDGLKLP